MPPLVSIIIPVYNTEQYLAECLASVCSQTLREIEIICVDDGSTDSSPVILKEFASRDHRIRVISQENQGRLSARNVGIHSAVGEWIGFVDSDDTVLPDMYQRLLENGKENHADISHSGLMFCYPDGHEIPHYGSGTIRLQDQDTGLTDLLDGSLIEPSMCCKLYRRELFQEFNAEKKYERNEDLYCNFILFGKAEKSVFEDFCSYRYRQRHGIFQSDETLMDILSVRYELIGMSSPSVRDAAYRLWLSTLVNTMNQLSVRQQNNSAGLYHECRMRLKEESDKISLLKKKQQIAAKLHLKSPRLARLIYSVYGKYTLYRYEH